MVINHGMVLLLSAALLAFGSSSPHGAIQDNLPAKGSWKKLLGGREYDAARGVALLKDGNLIVAGETSSNDGDIKGNHAEGDSDAWFALLSPEGRVLRTQCLGGTESDTAECVAPTKDGGFILAGSSSSSDGDVTDHHGEAGTSDFWVVKLDARCKIQWSGSIGGTADDHAQSVIQTADHGFLVAGDSFSNDGDARGQHRCACSRGCAGTRDFLAVKLDSSGKIEWARSVGGSNHEYISQMIQVKDGGYVLVGRTESFDGDVQGFKGEYDAWVVKLDSKGKLLWQRTLGGELWDWGSAIAETVDGDLMFAGYTYSHDTDGEGNHGDYDYLVARLDRQGTVRWTRAFGGLMDDFAHAILPLRDGSFLVSGASASFDGDVGKNQGSFDIWTIRVELSGNLVSQTSFGGTEYEIVGLGASAVETTDGGVILVGETESNDQDFSGNKGDYDLFVARILPNDLSSPIKNLEKEEEPDSVPGVSEEIAWERSYGGSKTDRPLDSPQAIARRSQGGYAFVGETQSADGDVTTANRGHSDVWVVAVDEKGEIEWQRSMGGSARDYGAAIAETKDGGLILVATTASKDGDVVGNHGMTDFWVVKLNGSGKVQWKKTLGGSLAEFATSIAPTPDGGAVVGGYAYSKDGDVKSDKCAYDFWLVRLDAKGGIVWSRTYGGSSNDYLIQVIATRDGGYAAVGRTESSDGDVTDNHGMYDYWVIKVQASGALAWQRNYGDWDWEWGNSIVETRDGGFVVAGYTYTFSDQEADVSENHGEFDYWVIKIDESGELKWERSFGGSNYELGYGIIQTSDGDFAMIGGSPSMDGQVKGNHGNWDFWLVRMSPKGDLRSALCLGGGQYDAGYALVESEDRGLVIIGESFSTGGDASRSHGKGDIWVVKVKPE